MNKHSEHELKDPKNWDYDHVEKREPVKSPRVIVSVAFRHEDYETISDYAERSGKRISEFIRDAALEKATGRHSEVLIYGFGNAGSLWSGNSLPSTTRTDVLTVLQEIQESAASSS